MNAKSSDTAKEIDLSGDLSMEGQRSLADPVQAFVIGQQSVKAVFNVTLGVVDISIHDEIGNVVYRKAILAYAGQRTFIDVTSFNQGEYSIVFTNSQGLYLEGDFVIQR